MKSLFLLYIMQSASLCSSTMNNCFAVYQKELTLLLIQASPTNRLLLFVTSAWDLLDLVKNSGNNLLPIRDSLSVQKFHLAFTAGTDDNLLFLLIHPSKNCLKIFFLIHPKDIIQYHRQTFFLTQKLSCSHAHGKINQLQSAAAETFQCFHSVPGSYCHVGCRIHLYVL